MRKKSIYVISWLDITPNEEIINGFCGAYNTKKKAKKELNRIIEEEKYKCDDVRISIEKINDSAKIIFDDILDNYIEYNITELQIK